MNSLQFHCPRFKAEATVKDTSCHEQGIGQDQATESKAKLRTPEGRYEALESCLIDPYVIWDLHGRILHINSHFEQTFGWTREEVLGHTIPFVPANEEAPTLQNLPVTPTGRPRPFRTRRLTKDGRMLNVIVSGSWLVDSRGEPTGFASIIRDLTEIDAPSDMAGRPNGLTACLFDQLQGKSTASQDLAEFRPNAIKEAVRLLIRSVQNQKSVLQERISNNLETTVRPLIDHLKSLDLTDAQRQVLETLDFNVKHIASYFGATVLGNESRLSAREIQICQMIRSGHNSREIAGSLGVTYQTVIAHRKNIRRKLGLKRSKRNLASHIKEVM